MNRIVVFTIAFVALLAIPLLLRPGNSSAVNNGAIAANAKREVIILTPNNEQIRMEFGRAFSAWHEKKYGESADVQWSTPGGAIDIRRMLVAAWESRLEKKLAVGGDADLIFGGGSFEFDTLKKEISVTVNSNGQALTHSATILEPVELPAALVQECYGMPDIAGQKLYDPKGYWYGVALATFGIVMNMDELQKLHVPELKSWSDLADPRLFGWVSLVNPAQSGSVLTAFESIAQRVGWLEGIAILRRAGANARGFAASGPRVPIDVSSGDAAAGVAIDFYARFQIQAISDAAMRAGRKDAQRMLIFTAPIGESSVDPDPIGLLRNAPHRETAIRFMEFCLTKDAQRLWQFRAGAPGGPNEFELRRMPIMRSLYANELTQFIDQVDPLTIASAVKFDNPSMRAFIPLLFSTMAMDSHAQLKAAWNAIISHPAYPRDHHGVVHACDVADAQLKSWLEKFDALPMVQTPDGAMSLADINQLKSLRDGWLRSGWKDSHLWPSQSEPVDALRQLFLPFFKENYQWIVDQAAKQKTA
jgi:ABC-type Fe3+ transport system substrate-binding protein